MVMHPKGPSSVQHSNPSAGLNSGRMGPLNVEGQAKSFNRLGGATGSVLQVR